MNVLYYGDNLNILREYIASESVDLVYLDPPFNSNRSYNVLFKDESGQEADAQITAFEDTWHWNPTTERAYHELVTQGEPRVGHMVGALCDAAKVVLISCSSPRGDEQLMFLTFLDTCIILVSHQINTRSLLRGMI